MNNLSWRDFWGDDADTDLAQSLEDLYESQLIRSCVYWIPLDDRNEPQSSDLSTRPREYATCGYTSEFEEWGQKKCQEAVDAGCTDADSVYKWIYNNPLISY